MGSEWKKCLHSMKELEEALLRKQLLGSIGWDLKDEQTEA